MNFGRRLREARLRRELVIDDVASRSGLSRAYISQVETGKASPSIQTLQKLAATLGYRSPRCSSTTTPDAL